MDESWIRMRNNAARKTKKTNLPSRRSIDEIPHRRREISGDSESIILESEDFNDVFGGPPRSVLHRRFSGDNYSRSSNSVYEEIFRPPGNVDPARSGRNLPEFRIPAGKNGRRSDRGFYSDIFGWDEEEEVRRRSRTRSGSKSKASSSSVLSSEDVSPLRRAIGDCIDDVSFFATKIRPINVSSRLNSTRSMHEDYRGLQGMPAFSCHPPSYNSDDEHNEDIMNSNRRFNRRNSSPETITRDPNSRRSLKVPTDDFEFNSPSYSICQDQEPNKSCRVKDEMSQRVTSDQDDDDEVMSSYVIEINGDSWGRTEEAIGVDDAIAWAKEKFQRYCSENSSRTKQEKELSEETEEVSTAHQFSEEQRDERESTQATMEVKPEKWATEEEKELLQSNLEMALFDKKIRLWSTGKEANIQLLLSTLHHIVWPNSGWVPVPLTNLIDSSHVRKAYQKARLCLHPDKLQQRSATSPQKYVAEKAFAILQDAWSAFVSQNVFFGH